jgi:hypothetical protein
VVNLCGFAVQRSVRCYLLLRSVNHLRGHFRVRARSKVGGVTNIIVISVANLYGFVVEAMPVPYYLLSRSVTPPSKSYPKFGGNWHQDIRDRRAGQLMCMKLMRLSNDVDARIFTIKVNDPLSEVISWSP